MTPAEITQLIDAIKQLGLGLGAIAVAITSLVGLITSLSASKRLDKHGDQIDAINRLLPSPLPLPSTPAATTTVNVDTEKNQSDTAP